ncbi:MAG: hypothetical protein IIT65_07310 [Lachnospiraceae bacterium]|nr:hypothetical protein [Lachnospiraceae bacterium]
MVARGMLVVIFIAIVISFSRCIGFVKRTEVNAIFILLLINSIYFIMGDVDRHNGFYANILLNLGIFFFSYDLSLKGKLSKNEIVVTYILLLVATSYRFFVEQEEMLYERNDQRATMNLAYAFVIYMPFVFYIRNKLLSIILVLFALFMVLNGAKRGAILIYALSVVYYVYYEYIRQIKKFKYRYIIIGLVGIVIAVQIAKRIYLENEYLQMRIENTMEGNSNGRDEIFSAIWDKWSTESSTINFVFGYGFCSSVDIAGNRAHNDWFEMMATAGLVGIITYIFFWIQLIRMRVKTKDELDKIVFTLTLLILFVKSLFSMSYCSVENMAIFLLLGFLTGQNRRNVTFECLLTKRLSGFKE